MQRGGEKQLGGDAHKTTVSVYTKNGVVRAEEEADDLYASIDAVSDKLERKLRKLKEKKKSQRRGTTRTTRGPPPRRRWGGGGCRGERRRIDFDEPVVEQFQAVRKCTAGDAAAEMETLNHTFFAFKNIAQGGGERRVQALGRRVRRDRAGGHGLTFFFFWRREE